MSKRINPEVAVQIAARLQDWIPLSDPRALTWATDLLDSSPDEDIRKTAARINEAAKQAARAARDVRYHDVFTAFTQLLKREIEAPKDGDLTLQAIPAITGDPHVNKLAASTTITDTLSGLLRNDEVEAEMALRRKMTPAEIAARRAELEEQREELVRGRPLPKFAGGK